MATSSTIKFHVGYRQKSLNPRRLSDAEQKSLSWFSSGIESLELDIIQDLVEDISEIEKNTNIIDLNEHPSNNNNTNARSFAANIINVNDMESSEPPKKKRKIIEEKSSTGKTKAKLKRRSSGRELDVQRAIMNFSNLDKTRCITLGNFTLRAEIPKEAKIPKNFEKTYLAHARYNADKTVVELELLKDRTKVKARAQLSDDYLLKASSEMCLSDDITAMFVHLCCREAITLQGRFIDPKENNNEIAIRVDVLLLPHLIVGKTDDALVNNNWIKPLQKLMAWVTNDNSCIMSLEADSKTFDPAPLYNAIRPLKDTNNNNNNNNTNVIAPEVKIEHPSLKTNLRKYQKRAVAWMVDRENKTIGDGTILVQRIDEVAPMWKKITTPTNQILYYNKFSGVIASELTANVQEMSGGILADEMGLGKTVEVLTLVLMNPKKDPMQVDEGNNINIEDERNNKKKKRKHNEFEDDQNPAEDSEDEFYDTYDQIRCYCGEFEETDDEYVLCERCKSWQHCRCIGFDPILEKGKNTIIRIELHI